MKTTTTTTAKKRITVKKIQSILRGMNPTEIFRLYSQIYGGKVERMAVLEFIKKYAPSQKVSKNAYYIAYAKNANKPIQADQDLKSIAWKVANAKHLAIEALKENIDIWRNCPAYVRRPYAKRPIMGNTHLWFCSPIYGFSDYNKWRAMPIEGNERFCETICKLADKYFV